MNKNEMDYFKYLRTLNLPPEVIERKRLAMRWIIYFHMYWDELSEAEK